MKQVLLGNSGLTVSEMCMGSMNFGTAVDKETSFRLLDAFVDAGGTFIDTSNNYAHWLGTGDESETLLGEWFEKTGKRDKIVLKMVKSWLFQKFPVKIWKWMDIL